MKIEEMSILELEIARQIILYKKEVIGIKEAVSEIINIALPEKKMEEKYLQEESESESELSEALRIAEEQKERQKFLTTKKEEDENKDKRLDDLRQYLDRQERKKVERNIRSKDKRLFKQNKKWSEDEIDFFISTVKNIVKANPNFNKSKLFKSLESVFGRTDKSMSSLYQRMKTEGRL